MDPFVYGLVDPREPSHVRYVGMACARANRPYLHARQARRSPAATHKINWIRSLQAEGRDPVVIVLEQLCAGTSRDLVGFVEQCYIRSLRKIGHCLTNLTDGGEGAANPSAENRAAKRERATGNTYSVGRRQPQEERDRRGRSIAKYWADHPGTRVISEAIRARIAETLMGRKHTPEACANMAAAHVGLKRTDEARANMSRAQTGRVFSLEAREKLAAAQTGRKASNETRAKQSLAIKKARSTPEARADASIKAKIAWNRRKAGVPST